MQTARSATFNLRGSAPDDIPPVLESVTASGRLHGVIFTMTLRQSYRNESARNLEVLYSFPLPAQAVLLGFAAEFGGRRLDGIVMPRTRAERLYEQALEDDDMAVRLEAAPGGVYTARLSNLRPGERAVLDIRFSQLLAFEQGQLRVVVPTTIAPRYGDAEAAGVAPHQVPAVSDAASYALALEIVVTGSLASARLECPTHPHTVERGRAGARLALDAGRCLDRDVVFVLTPLELRPDLLVTSPQADGTTVALAAFELPPPPLREHISLALLLDASGLMGGDSIDSARRPLHGVTDALGRADDVSFSRFGRRVEHVLTPSPCASAVLSHLRQAVDTTQANTGGKEMASALRSVFGLWSASKGADVLLVTDGEVWNAQALVSAARDAGHRVFAIGVGRAPAEAVLRRVAEATGGACEFATPGEALEVATARMLARIRQVRRPALRIDWGARPAWKVAPAKGVFGGDMVLAWAGFERGRTPGASVRLLAASAAATGGASKKGHAGPKLARTHVRVPAEGLDVARIVAWKRLPLVADRTGGAARPGSSVGHRSNPLRSGASASRRQQAGPAGRVASCGLDTRGGMGRDGPHAPGYMSLAGLLRERHTIRIAPSAADGIGTGRAGRSWTAGRYRDPRPPSQAGRVRAAPCAVDDRAARVRASRGRRRFGGLARALQALAASASHAKGAPRLTGLGLAEATAWLLLAQRIDARARAQDCLRVGIQHGHVVAPLDARLRMQAAAILERCLAPHRDAIR